MYMFCQSTMELRSVHYSHDMGWVTFVEFMYVMVVTICQFALIRQGIVICIMYKETYSRIWLMPYNATHNSLNAWKTHDIRRI